MANIIFAERENAGLHPPTLKMRQRLQSAPGMEMPHCPLMFFFVCVFNLYFLPPEKLLKSPMTAKTFNTPLPSGRKAFGTVNKKILTPAVNTQEKKLLKPQVGINHG